MRIYSKYSLGYFSSTALQRCGSRGLLMHAVRWFFPPCRTSSTFRRLRAPQLMPQESISSVALVRGIRGFFVCFRETPNEACYKFFVKGVEFLPQSASTLRFDLNNCHQSPLARDILHNLPMVEEVTIGKDFVTVRRVDADDAVAAARLYAVKLGRSPVAGADEVAERSIALQQHVTAAINEGNEQSASPSQINMVHGRGSGDQSGDGNVEREERSRGESDAQDELSEDALRDLMLATHWSELKLAVSALITDHLYSGQAHIDMDVPHPHPDTLPQDGDSEVVVILKELISTTIRPQLQLDGGDIRFVGLRDSVMLVEMLGACRKCKKSKTTLRDMIERTTRHWVPEVLAVEEIETAYAFGAPGLGEK